MDIFSSFQKKSYADLRVVITGALGGVGYELVRTCLLAGDTVIAIDWKEEPPAYVKNAKLRYYKGNVGDSKRIRQIVQEILRDVELGGLVDVIVNTAVVCDLKPLMELDEQTMGDAFQVNVLGSWRMTKEFLPLLKKSRCPCILNIGSDSSFLHPAPFTYPYLGTKIAVSTLTRTMRMELACENIEVVFCNTGSIQTSLYDKVLENYAKCEPTSVYKKATSLAREVMSRFLPLWKPCSADFAAETIYHCIHKGRRPSNLYINRNPITRLLWIIPQWLHDEFLASLGAALTRFEY